jgi:hypothetical protein
MNQTSLNELMKIHGLPVSGKTFFVGARVTMQDVLDALPPKGRFAIIQMGRNGSQETRLFENGKRVLYDCRPAKGLPLSFKALAKTLFSYRESRVILSSGTVGIIKRRWWERKKSGCLSEGEAMVAGYLHNIAEFPHIVMREIPERGVRRAPWNEVHEITKVLMPSP